MSSKERGLFRIIFREFIKSLTPKFSKTTCVGEDSFGTKYFEVNNPKNNSKRPNRYFVPMNTSKFDQELPAEWEAWLRFRRDNPPTKLEVEQGYQMIITKKKNADNLKNIYYEGITSLDPNEKIVKNHASQKFPIYQEYENYGANHQNKK